MNQEGKEKVIVLTPYFGTWRGNRHMLLYNKIYNGKGRFEMPAIIGPVEIANVTVEGIVHFGDTVFTSPKTQGKTFSGSGGFNTGGIIVTNNGVNATNVLDANLIDEPILGNN